MTVVEFFGVFILSALLLWMIIEVVELVCYRYYLNYSAKRQKTEYKKMTVEQKQLFTLIAFIVGLILIIEYIDTLKRVNNRQKKNIV